MADADKWSQRRLRHCKQYGIKSEVASEKLRSTPRMSPPEGPSPLDEDDSRRAYNVCGVSTHTARSAAVLSRTQSLDRTRRSHGAVDSGIIGAGGKRESVFQMACKGLNSVVNGDFFRHMQNGSSSASRAHAATVGRVPTYISVRDKDRSMLGYCSFPSASSNNHHQQHHHNSRGEPAQAVTTTMIQFDSDAPVFAAVNNTADGPTTAAPKMDGGGEEEGGEEQQQQAEPSSTHFFLHPQDQVEDLDEEDIFDVLFFDQQEPPGQASSANDNKVVAAFHQPGKKRRRISPQQLNGNGATSLDRFATVSTGTAATANNQPKKRRSKLQRFAGLFGSRSEERVSRLRSLAKFNFSIRRGGGQQDEAEKPAKLPMYGRFISDPELIKMLKDDSCDYRPYFTYWISTVHVLVLLFMLLNYGVGTDFSSALFNPFGVIERSGDVMTSSLSAAHIVVWEQNNIWIGPKYADLVHAGAKYTPCMRRDARIYDQILQERQTEAESTGCCIGPWGCYQSSECPKQFAQLLKWLNGSFPESDFSRAVCGQDPRFCLRPRSVHPFLWGLNITNWPVCEQRARSIPARERHMHCELTGRPCCIQMHGQCRIASREYCDFVGGFFHENATLCSQVSCLNEVCGMTSFLRRDQPDQIFRLLTPLFIHAGVIRCAISLAIYLTIMRRFEIMIGWLRLSTIYFVSGFGGYLASAVFVPYMPEVGPVGSEGGILGALIVNIVYNWDLLSKPWHALLFHLAIAGALFILGFLPWIDNWAQLFGFIFGSLMAIVLIPYITIGQGRVSQRLPVVVGSLCATSLLFAVLFLLFFAYPINFEALALLNCPFTTKICDQQGMILRNWLPI